MVSSPDVVSTSTSAAIVVAASGFTAGETVTYSVSGATVGTGSSIANSDGRVAFQVNSASTQSYYLVSATGASSGKQAGTAGRVLNAAPPVPGLAIVPHAINPSGSTRVSARNPAPRPGTFAKTPCGPRTICPVDTS